MAYVVLPQEPQNERWGDLDVSYNGAPPALEVPSLWRECGGLLVTVTLLGLLAWLLTGCVTAYTQCDYDEKTAKLTEATGWSNVVGKGDVDNVVTTCKTLMHESHDTGLDDNVALLGAAIADAARKATPTGAAASAIETVTEALDDDELPLPPEPAE